MLAVDDTGQRMSLLALKLSSVTAVRYQNQYTGKARTDSESKGRKKAHQNGGREGVEDGLCAECGC